MRTLGCLTILLICAAFFVWLARQPTVNRDLGIRLQATADARMLRSALLVYRSQYRSLPALPAAGSTAPVYASGPRQNVDLGGHWREKRSAAGEFLDPWKHPFVFRVTGDSFTVLSGGPDGRLATADDISSDD